jgi:hypothetical protein
MKGKEILWIIHETQMVVMILKVMGMIYIVIQMKVDLRMMRIKDSNNQ